MRTKRMVLLALLVVSMAVVMTVNSHAAEGLYTCTVTAAGPVTKVNGVAETPTMQFSLTRVSGTPTWTWKKTAQACAGQEKQMLAIALTAISNTRNVAVWFDPAVGIIYNMQLK